jgi:hypothetical protein
MKNTLIILLVFINYFLAGQNTSGTEKYIHKEKSNPSSIIKYRVLLKDTTQLKTILQSFSPEDFITDYSDSHYSNYLDPFSYNKLCRFIKKSLISPKNLIGETNGGVLYDKITVKNIIHSCDSANILSVDINGNELIKKMNICDSIWLFENLKAIDFTETWTIDSKSFEFKKNVLAIDLIGYKKAKKELGLKHLLTIYRDEESYKKIKVFFTKNLD